MVAILILPSCSTKEEDRKIELIGKWKLIELYSDLGDGSGIFNPVQSDKRIEFKTNGEYISNGTLCHMSIESNQTSSGIYSSSEMTISPSNCELQNNLTFEINDSFLIINYFCIEGCGEKYKKID